MNRLYTDLDFPATYAGINALQRETRGRPESKQLKDFLLRDRTYTLHRPRRYKFKRLKTIPLGYCTDVQADLADFQRLSRQNKGYKYLLVTIDVLSRQIYVSPTKSKFAKDVIPAFRDVFKKMPRSPISIYSDRGNEFESREMKSFFKELNIQKFASQTSHVKAAFAERAIRTIKTRLYKYFSEKNTQTWYDIIDKLVNAINNSICRTTKMRPNDVNEGNAQELWDSLYKEDNQKEIPKFKIGDHVRLAVSKEAFDKGYLANYSDEILDIAGIRKTNPPTYVLQHEDGSVLKGKFYKHQLVKTLRDKNTTYRVEKVLRRKTKNGKKYYYVKYVGLPVSHNQWITDDDFV